MSVSTRIASTDAVLRSRVGASAWVITLLGAVLAIVSTFLPWTYDSSFAGDLTVTGFPGGPQVWVLVLGALTALAALLSSPLARRVRLGGVRGAARAGALVRAVLTVLTAVQITKVLGGTANVAPGLWIGVVGSLAALVGSRAVAADVVPRLRRKVPDVIAVLAIVVGTAAGLFGAAQLLNTQDPILFVDLAIFIGGLVLVLARVGVTGWYGEQSHRLRAVTIGAVFLAALAFPFTQNGSDANMSIAVQVLVFVAAALGLNIVIGYAGLLDLGYVAFVGAGAYTSALLSGSAFSAIGWQPPFIVTALIGLLVSATLGLIIGLPTLRLRGDYLAIVTLAFGEIFRIAVQNLDGVNGPNLTNGPNGIPSIPDFDWFGFDFGSRTPCSASSSASSPTTTCCCSCSSE